MKKILYSDFVPASGTDDSNHRPSIIAEREMKWRKSKSIINTSYWPVDSVRVTSQVKLSPVNPLVIESVTLSPGFFFAI